MNLKKKPVGKNITLVGEKQISDKDNFIEFTPSPFETEILTHDAHASKAEVDIITCLSLPDLSNLKKWYEWVYLQNRHLGRLGRNLWLPKGKFWGEG